MQLKQHNDKDHTTPGQIVANFVTMPIKGK